MNNLVLLNHFHQIWMVCFQERLEKILACGSDFDWCLIKIPEQRSFSEQKSIFIHKAGISETIQFSFGAENLFLLYFLVVDMMFKSKN